jgi:hypothetical protein
MSLRPPQLAIVPQVDHGRPDLQDIRLPQTVSDAQPMYGRPDHKTPGRFNLVTTPIGASSGQA